MTIYNLSKSGKTITWTEWKKHDGCGISNVEIGDISAALGPEDGWKRKGVTLGDIADVSKVAERNLARYAKERWQRDDLVTVEYA